MCTPDTITELTILGCVWVQRRRDLGVFAGAQCIQWPPNKVSERRYKGQIDEDHEMIGVLCWFLFNDAVSQGVRDISHRPIQNSGVGILYSPPPTVSRVLFVIT